MENQGHISIPVNSSIEVIEPQAISPLLNKVTIKVCYVGEDPNRNGSIITKETATKMAPSLRGCPIVGYYNDTKGDFERHNQIIDISNGEWKFKDTTQAYGFVDLNARTWFQKFTDDGVEHEYLMTEGYLWGQFPESQRVIDKGNPQSMELDDDHLSGHWSEEDNQGMSFYIINDAVISKLCILGEDVEPCFEGASVTRAQFSLDPSLQQKIAEAKKEVEEINSKGGTYSVEDEKKLEEEQKATPEEEEVKPEEEEGKTPEQKEEKPEAQEETPEAKEEESKAEGKPVEYNLDEIQEYVELKKNYDSLQTKFNAMQKSYNELVAFKNEVGRKAKQAKIDEFYMLSDGDKKDVVDNMDKYTVDEIEEKLAVICFRNKVSFDLDEKKKEEDVVTTFNLESNPSGTELDPGYIEALRATKAEME